METAHHSLDELCSLANVPKRTVRFYIQNNLVDKPCGANRGAYYTERHLEQLLTIVKWQNAGLSLDRIREILDGPPEKGGSALPPPRPRHAGDVVVKSHVTLASGIELCIDAEEARLTPEQVRALARGITQLLTQVRTTPGQGEQQ